MARVFEGGVDTFNALVYGERHPSTENFLREQLETSNHLLNAAGQQFVQTAHQLYDQVAGSNAIRLARAARRAVGSLWQSNEIRELGTIAEMQWAQLNMQRWIMAEPTVRQMYKDQTIEGYEGSYVDPFNGEGVGEDHYDWRRVNNGIVTETENDSWTATTYFEELLDTDRELGIEEQVDIKETWSNIVAMIRKGGDDPTSRWNASL